jgi:hypothetical protein
MHESYRHSSSLDFFTENSQGFICRTLITTQFFVEITRFYRMNDHINTGTLEKTQFDYFEIHSLTDYIITSTRFTSKSTAWYIIITISLENAQIHTYVNLSTPFHTINHRINQVSPWNTQVHILNHTEYSSVWKYSSTLMKTGRGIDSIEMH